MTYPLSAASYTRHTSSYMCVGCLRLPQSLTYVSSWGLTQLPPSCNLNYFGYLPFILSDGRVVRLLLTCNPKP
ncbi:hypothetical protein EFV65_16795 [Yersinia enterocolitica]|nr:hypothetical protein [Yersinia enterocolitica]